VRREVFMAKGIGKALIMAGLVYVNGQRVDKAGTRVLLEAEIEVRGEACPYVSRGGLKLEHALKEFEVTVDGLVCADTGASTGGFTDCLLQHGAAKVYAIDVGHGQLHWRLRQDPRVVVMEGVNARYLKPEDLPEAVDLATIDVSFISLTKVLPAVVELVKPGGQIIALIKPQFEVGPREVGKGGVVRDPALHRRVVEKIKNFATGLELTILGVTESPILGPAGNKEFLIHLKRS
jgi:23S rRNA (cytidine1920-2'-O)/16S rRNA (cytidine1409-2'-O)-methyltransferase